MMGEQKEGLLERLARAMGLKQGQVGLLRMLLLALVVGMVFVNADRLFGLEEPAPPSQGSTLVSTPPIPVTDDLMALEESMARSLEQTLSSVAGAGRLQVRLTLLSGPTVLPFYKTQDQTGTTREKAQDGSTRDTTQTNESREVIVQRGLSGHEVMPVMKKSRAEIAGVLVVAEGARNDRVRAQLLRSTATALGIPAHRIDVVPFESR